MNKPSPWATIHREREALADDLMNLPLTSWTEPSLCSGWTVHQVLGHMVATAKMTPVRFVTKLAASGFRFQAMIARDLAAETAGTPERTLAEFRAHAGDSTGPPGPVESWLGETIVHSTDIRWPLGRDHEFPLDVVVRVAAFYSRSNALIGAKSRVSGIGLRATDTTWTTGTGPAVSGPILALVMAMTGRKAALPQLSGAGLDLLTARFDQGAGAVS